MAGPDAGIVTSDPGGPPIDLPTWEGDTPVPVKPRIEITPERFEERPYEEPKVKETKPSPPKVAGFEERPYTEEEPKKEPTRKVGGGTAFGLGLGHTIYLGSRPAVAGLESAADQGLDDTQKTVHDAVVNAAGPVGPLVKPVIGLARMLHEKLANHGDSTIRDAYHRGREEALANDAAASEQHGWAYLAGQLTGGVATPAFGALRAGTAGQRILNGMRAGGTGGAAYGVGSSVSENLKPEDALKRTIVSTLIGTGAGGIFGGAFGPRPAPTGPATRAAETADRIGGPLPRGLASESSAVRSATAAGQSWPVVGARIRDRLGRTGRAVEREVGDISDRALGSGGGRNLSDVIASNKQAQNTAYDAVRGQINDSIQVPMRRTRTAVDEVMRRRSEAHWDNPGQGLEQFDRAANGSNFSGAHRARGDARDAGGVNAPPNPGFNRGDYKLIEAAMSEDLREVVGAAAAHRAVPLHPGQRATSIEQRRRAMAAARAIRDFDRAEEQFGRLAEQNNYLQRVIDKRGSGANVLQNLGQNDATGQFSVSKFVTEWNKMADSDKRALFDAQHRREIDEIVHLGEHIKHALRDQNTSHTAGVLITFDLIRDALILGASQTSHLATGSALASPETAIGATAGLSTALLMRWLGSPATARSLGSWMRAYRGVTNSPTPVRMAAFQTATRNLSHNIGVPPERIFSHARAWATGQNEDHDDLK